MYLQDSPEWPLSIAIMEKSGTVAAEQAGQVTGPTISNTNTDSDKLLVFPAMLEQPTVQRVV